MKEVDAFKTVDCLRGRLQAERAASRAAAENADLLAKKLTELEEQLKIEIRCRRKAEKKLKFLKKKLESLNISCSTIITEENEISTASNYSETSCMSSNSCTSNDHHQEPAHQITESEASKCSSISSQIAGETMTESEIVTTGRQNSDENGHGIQASALEEKSHENENEKEENQDEHQVDDSMALVLVSSTVESNDSPVRPIMEAKGGNVEQVLHSLKQIRENLQSSLDRRRVINVG